MNFVNGCMSKILLPYEVLISGDTVIIARNCHKSAYNGVILADLNPHYIIPEIDCDLGIAHVPKPESITEAIAEV